MNFQIRPLKCSMLQWKSYVKVHEDLKNISKYCWMQHLCHLEMTSKAIYPGANLGSNPSDRERGFRQQNKRDRTVQKIKA